MSALDLDAIETTRAAASYYALSDCTVALIAEVRRLREINGRLDRENVELRQGINGTEWENELVANAPEWLDDDVAQSETVTRYVRWLESVVAAADRRRAHGAPGHSIWREYDVARNPMDDWPEPGAG